MIEISDKWVALINWARENPYSTIEKLEIHNGEPVLVIYKKTLTQYTEAKIKYKL